MTSSFSINSKPVNVLVTGVGAIIGQGIVKSLRQSRYHVRVIGVDRNAQSLGLHLCDNFYAKPPCDESSADYLSFWQCVLERESVDLVLPGLEIDLFFFNGHRKSLGAIDTTLGLNTIELVELARDKWLLYKELPKSGLVPIPTLLTHNWSECLEQLGMPPFLLKPRQGSGSQGIVRLNDENDLQYWADKSGGDFIIQKIIGQDNEEYTVGVFGLGNGNTLPPIIFRRLLSGTGSTQYAEVVYDSVLEQAIMSLNLYFKPIGPTNYQFRKAGNTIYLLEINPRLSSSTSLRTGFGYNESEMAIDFYFHNIQPETPKVSSGRAWRYSADFILK